jgi:carbamoyltransferase
MVQKYYLGISISHNSSAALMCDGKIVAAACEERFNREKNYVGFPIESIRLCLNQAGITGKQIEKAAYSTISNSGLLVKAQTNTKFSISDYHKYYGEDYYAKVLAGEVPKQYLLKLRDDSQFNSGVQHFDFNYLTDEVVLDRDLDIELFQKEQIRILNEQFEIDAMKIEFLDHHYCHANYAYFASPFRNSDCLVITMDGWGDGRNQTVWKVQGEKLELLADSTQNEIGRIYKLATLILGMRPDEHEFKVMGLAPYAKDSYVLKALEPIKDICEVDGLRIIHKNRPEDLYKYLVEKWKVHRFDNIAGAVQKLTEDLACQLVNNAIHETGISRVVLGGGIAMNIKMNQSISELDAVSEIYIAGSNGDESLSIGACYALEKRSKTNQCLDNMYLGYDVSDEIDQLALLDFDNDFIVEENPEYTNVAHLLLEGNIVGWIQGQAEFGARALGNRSILANPSIRDSVQKINEAIKNRDFWMPFALSILEEEHQRYIFNPKGIKSPVMSMGFNSIPENYQMIEAGTHPYDKTVRPQFVSEIHNPEYHRLISEYFKVSGVPALLNTSFNLHGEPIVNSVKDAIRTFRMSELDYLLIGNRFLLSKKTV